MKILVTGATGFLGRAILQKLDARPGISVLGSVRSAAQQQVDSERLIAVGDMNASTDWGKALAAVDTVVHTAARVHVMQDSSADPLSEYRRINVEGSLNLARQALEAGVRRFIFISSIKVNGEGTRPGEPYRADDTPAPVDPYGISKLEAEQGIRDLCAGADMEWIVLRPTLVYGPGVKANFLSMMRWLRRGIPLPLALTANKRSFVALDNLVDLVATCIASPNAANRVFLVSDGQDLSTAELLTSMGKALGRPARLWPFPVWMLRLLAGVAGKSAIAQRLFGSLQVDISETRARLGWSPPVSVDEAMRKTADHFLQQSERR